MVKNFFKEKFLEGLQGEANWWETNEKQVESMGSFEKGFVSNFSSRYEK